ncbi:MAG: hypothetical protein C4331_03840 [Meiothermus sp.]
MDLRERTLELAQEYRKNQAPLTPERLVGGIGANLTYTRLPDGQDGAFDFETNTILIAEGQTPKRQRFTLAHEVMHYLIHEDDDLLSELHETYEGDELEARLEALCNLGAAEMLLPREAVEAGIAKRGQSPKLIPELAALHQVSEEVAIIALAERGPSPSIVLMAGGKPVKVFFSAKSERIFDRVRRNVAVPKDHPLTLALETALPYKGKAPLPGNGTLYALDAFPKGGRVYAVFKELLN